MHRESDVIERFLESPNRFTADESESPIGGVQSVDDRQADVGSFRDRLQLIETLESTVVEAATEIRGRRYLLFAGAVWIMLGRHDRYSNRRASNFGRLSVGSRVQLSDQT